MNKLTSLQNSVDFTQLASDIKRWGSEFGFNQVSITDTDLQAAEAKLEEWLKKGHHGEMAYMGKHGRKRSRPAELVANTLRIIVARMDYLPPNTETLHTLNNPQKAYISRYALGRDYHKVLRQRLHKLAEKITSTIGHYTYRVFVDSAPVLEKPLAAKAGLGWMGKHTVILNREAGSYFFLGVIYTDLPLPIDSATSAHCGSCSACVDLCPTKAIIAPYELDARRCISYLTIEYRGSIPLELRPLMGNRIFGCDDCQLVCPWNRFAKPTAEPDFQPRHGLTSPDLLTLFAWTETEFLEKTAGSAIRRAGYEGWLRNIAVALGNAPYSAEIVAALKSRRPLASSLLLEHIDWAIQQQTAKKP